MPVNPEKIGKFDVFFDPNNHTAHWATCPAAKSFGNSKQSKSGRKLKMPVKTVETTVMATYSHYDQGRCEFVYRTSDGNSEVRVSDKSLLESGSLPKEIPVKVKIAR